MQHRKEIVSKGKGPCSGALVPHMRRILDCEAGVLFVGRADGLLEVWDLLERSHEPVLVSAASTAAVTVLRFSPAAPTDSAPKGRSTQQLLAVGGPLFLWNMQSTSFMQQGLHVVQPTTIEGPCGSCS